MTFAVATMVITSHAGQSEQLKHRSKIISFLAFAVVLATCLRIASVFFPSHYFQFLGSSSFLWLAAAFLWLVRMTPLIFTFPEAEDIASMHANAKERILNLRRK